MFADLFMKDKPMSFTKQNFRNDFIREVDKFNRGVDILKRYSTEASDVVIEDKAILFTGFDPISSNDLLRSALIELGFVEGEGNDWRY